MRNLLDTRKDLQRRLLAEMTAAGYWEGRLSDSALANAIAVFALSRVDREEYAETIKCGLDWIAAQANDDGGWGDSPESRSNVTATVLCWVAFSLSEDREKHGPAIAAGEAWLRRAAGSLAPAAIHRAILKRYGDDRTFAAPILTMCALSGRFGNDREAWDMVPQLPFELMIFPHWLFGWLKLSVVSYALPALIAIGYVRHRQRPSRNPLLRWLRHWIAPRALRIAERMQPENGGYEEATPLTGFVTMSLAAAGQGDSRVVKRATAFLVNAMRADGGMAIDTNLATWLTTLSVKALGADGLDDAPGERIREWLLGQQHNQVHPLTYGAPGGWAWTDLPGGMPDADDTPGVLLALRRLGAIDDRVQTAAARGVSWLMDLQNSDGGTPTFAKGWGKLPFDRSCPDVTAHVMWALDEWQEDLPDELRRRVLRRQQESLEYLADAQRKDGSWIPLWFGNQWFNNEEGPVYGTARVVDYLHQLKHVPASAAEPLTRRGCEYLISVRNADGGWGGTRETSSVEETALALKALLQNAPKEVLAGGIDRLQDLLETDGDLPAAPIGLYFAKLWYAEKLYPLIFALDAITALASSPDHIPGRHRE